MTLLLHVSCRFLLFYLLLRIVLRGLLQFKVMAWSAAEIGACPRPPILFRSFVFLLPPPSSLAASFSLSLGRSRSLHRANMDGVIRRHKSRKEDGRESGRASERGRCSLDVWHGEGGSSGIGAGREETLLHARWTAG